MRRSEIAGRAGVHPETVRYYERRGLLPEPPRDDAGHRQYGPQDLRRLYFIRRAKELGLSLERIETLLALRPATGEPDGAAKRVAAQALREVRTRRRTLEYIRDALKTLHRTCGGTGGERELAFLDVLQRPLDAQGT